MDTQFRGNADASIKAGSLRTEPPKQNSCANWGALSTRHNPSIP